MTLPFPSPDRSPADRFRVAPLAVLCLALALVLAPPPGPASILDLFKGQKASQEKQDELQETYAAAATLEKQGKTLAAIERLKRCVELAPESEFLRLRLAESCLAVTDPAGAETAVEPLAQLENLSGSVRGPVNRVLARAALQRNQYDRSIALYEQSLVDQPDNLQALQALAVLYFEHAKNLEKTKEVCGHILSLDGRNLSALLYNAEACALTGDVETAIDLYRRIVRYRPQLMDRLDELAQRLSQRGERDKALYLYRQGVLLMPSSDLLKRGFESLAGNGDTTATLEAYRSLADEAPRNVDIQVLYAERLLQVRHWDEAEAIYRKILETQPNNVAAFSALAEISLQRGNVDEALARFEEAIARSPNDPEVYATVARLYLMRGDIAKSEQLLNRALALGGKNATALVLLADVLERKGQLDDAEKRLKEALDALPANPTLLTLLAGFYTRHDRPAEAVEVMEQMLAVRPRDLGLYAQILRYYLQEKRAESADTLLQRGRKVFEDGAEFDIVVGQVAAREHNYTMAEDALKRATTADPANLDARILLAGVYLTTAREDEAVKTLLAIESFLRDPDQQYAWRLAVGGVYMQLRRWSDAVEQFKKARDLNPHEFGVYPGFVESLLRAGKTDEAINTLNEAVREFMVAKPKEVQLLRGQTLQIQKEYQRAQGIYATLAKEYPRDSDVFFSQATLFGEMGNIEAAEASYRKVIDLEPENATAYNNLGYLLAQKGLRLDEAEQLVRKALELQPGAGFILDSLGWISYQKGNLDEAVTYLEQAKERSAPDPEIYDHLGEVYRKQGKAEAAAGYFEKAVRLDPERTDIRKKMDELKKTGP